MNTSHVRPIQVLLVEDNPGDVRLTQEAFKESHVLCDLHLASDGERALDFLFRRGDYQQAPTPDLILLDLNLPRRNGREVLAELKNHPELCRIPVVILTTSQAEEDVVRAYQLHANCYISKPVDFEQFIKVVRCIDEFWLTVVRLPPGSQTGGTG
jgi:two-component system, chemotaxis family, response regulator Rcp1